MRGRIYTAPRLTDWGDIKDLTRNNGKNQNGTIFGTGSEDECPE